MEILLELWRSLDPELQGAIVGGIGGGIVGGVVGGMLSIVGVAAGAWLGRFLRRQGEVRCAFTDWNLDTVNRPANFSFIGKFFNEKDKAIGLRDIRIVFCQGKKEMVTEELYFGFEAGLDPSGRPGHSRFEPEYTGKRAEAINLPSGQWLSRPLIGKVLDQEGQDNLPLCNRAVLRGYWPKGRRFEEEIESWTAGCHES